MRKIRFDAAFTSKILVAIAAVAALIGVAAAAPAAAADMAIKAQPPAAAYNWSGFYVGANGGGGWSDPGGVLTALTAGFAGLPSAAMPTNYGLKSSGGFGGLDAGYNLQSQFFLWGIEADIQDGNIRGQANSAFPGAFPISSSVNSVSSELSWFATVRGRVGLTFDRTLIYATGGLTIDHVKDSVINNFSSPVNLFGKTSTTRAGWTIGGGLEYAVTNTWSLKAEYLYMNLGSIAVTATDPINFPGQFATYSFRHRYDIARGGVNYRF
jgi:outer membrane immunogenic protein